MENITCSCDICAWTKEINNFENTGRFSAERLECKRNISILNQILFGDITKYLFTHEDIDEGYTFFIFQSCIRVAIILSRLSTSDKFHIELLMELVENIYRPGKILELFKLYYSIRVARRVISRDIKKLFIHMLKVVDSMLPDNQNLYILYKYLWTVMNDYLTEINFSSIYRLERNKLNTIKFVVEELEIPLLLKTDKIDDDDPALELRNIFFNFPKNLDIIEYILNKNKIYPTHLYQLLSGVSQSFEAVKGILQYAKSRKWNLLILKNDFERLQWWIKYSVEKPNTYTYLYDLYQKQNIEKILLMKLVFSKLPEDLETKIMDYIL